jgi:hypothetical protein
LRGRKRGRGRGRRPASEASYVEVEFVDVVERWQKSKKGQLLAPGEQGIVYASRRLGLKGFMTGRPRKAGSPAFPGITNSFYMLLFSLWNAYLVPV